MTDSVKTGSSPEIEIDVNLEFTPNPNNLKYVTNVRLLLAGAENYTSAEQAHERSPLATELFKIVGINGVMVGSNFVTVALVDQDSITELNDKIIDTLKSFVKTGKPAVNPNAITAPSTQRTDLSEIESRIVAILDAEIRPAVAMDGGDITFEKYQDGIVFLQMKGACSGCPSSTATLKMGIENRLRDAIPEIIEVVAV